jgi:hypothetical protein
LGEVLKYLPTSQYGRKAQAGLPSLGEYERMRAKFAEMSKSVVPVMASACHSNDGEFANAKRITLLNMPYNLDFQ